MITFKDILRTLFKNMNKILSFKANKNKLIYIILSIVESKDYYKLIYFITFEVKTRMTTFIKAKQ